MKRITLAQAIEEMSKDNWTGKTIFAKANTSEVNIYRGINTQTFEPTGLCIDIVSYNKIDHAAAQMFLDKIGIGYKDATIAGPGGQSFYTLNAG